MAAGTHPHEYYPPPPFNEDPKHDHLLAHQVQERCTPSALSGSATMNLAIQFTSSEGLPPSYQDARRFRSHGSEEEYLAALRNWVESKQYIDNEPSARGSLVGFYGNRTLDDGRQAYDKEKRMKEEEKVRRREDKRNRKAEHGENNTKEDGQQTRRKRSLASVFGHRRSIAN